MKINFKLDERKISKSSRSKIYDLGQVTTTVQNLLDNSEITITDNLIPIIKITRIDNETSYYLLPDLNYDWGNISGRNNYSFTINDLIALGGNSGGGSTPDATPTDGSSNAVSSNGVFDALALKQDFAVARTGAVIAFDALAVYNSFSSPTASNITNDLTGAKIGIVQKIYSNKATEPTYPAGWVKLSGTYTNSVTNIIYAEWCEGSRVEYWIVKA